MTRRGRAGLAVFALLAASAPGCKRSFDTEAAGWEGRTALVTVHTGRILGPVNPLVFGQNIEGADSRGVFSATSNPVLGRTGDGIWDPDHRRPVPEALDLARKAGVRALRYPGGCLTHNFDWKQAVGPVEDRPEQRFGLHEFLEVCRAIEAVPVLTLSAYRSNPRDAAGLVEYLNTPAVEGHPWAKRRAESGHPEPFGVVYFEIGNEVDHGNHDLQPPRSFSPAEYAAFFDACAQSMRAVDPGIRLGVSLRCAQPDNRWNRTVLSTIRTVPDFLILHTYAVGVWGEHMLREREVERAMRACMAAGDQLEADLRAYRALAKRCIGREIPLAITEYNAAFVQENLAPLRFALGPALFSADYIRVLLKPEHQVLVADYWQFLNGYWGMVHGPRTAVEKEVPWKTMAAFPLFQLWAEHFGDRLVAVEVEGPRLEFEGFLEVDEVRGSEAYPALTAAASLSQDGRKLYLILFNKHHAKALPASIRIEGHHPRSARRWTVAGPSLEAHNREEMQVRESVTAAPILPDDSGAFTERLPACSMNAIEILLEPDE